MDEKKSYVYIITNKVTEDCYIGITKEPEKRWLGHQSVALLNKDDRYLYRAMRKYGVSNFSFSVVEEYVDDNETKEAEVWMITYLRSLGAKLYNLTAGGDGVRNPTPETRRKMGVHRGKHLSESHRKSLSEAGKGRVFSEETRRKLSESQKGKIISEESRRKNSEAQRGKKTRTSF